MNDAIKSGSNRTIKFIKSLHMKKYRDEYGKFLIEGEKLLREALDYNALLFEVLVSRGFAESGNFAEYEAALLERGVPLFVAEDSVFKAACETDTPQGIIAVAGKPGYELDSIISREELCLVVLHELRDPGNAGTIIRTADACGIDAVLLSKDSVDVYNGKTIRATMGSLFHIPVIQNLDTAEVIGKLKSSGITTVGADPHGSESCIELPGFKRSAIIIGNESKGISGEIKAILDTNVKIPMPGRAESLNAGIAAAILMYEFSVRKRYAK